MNARQLIEAKINEGAVFGGGAPLDDRTQRAVERLWSEFDRGTTMAQAALKKLERYMTDGFDTDSMRELRDLFDQIEDLTLG